MDKETSEIAKLTGRISKDPKSKLFVPLAEEYKKAGDIDMAIHVLLEGLKNNPDYVIARSSLGKLMFAKGDWAGAQKEFEDVVKAIPENVMAQKKLGDLFVLQSRPLDALPHYKIALALNPGDGEVASLISDVEAGRDVRTKIQAFKAKTSDIKQEQPATAAASEPAPVPVSPQPQPSDVETKMPDETPRVFEEVSPSPFAEPTQAMAASVTEAEEPEEVLIVEPLEVETSSQEPVAAGFAPSGEEEPRGTYSLVSDESFNLDFPAGDQPPDEPVFSQDIRPEAEPFTDENREAIPTGVSEAIDADEISGTGFGEEAIENIPEPSFEDVSGKSDDFTTDTLAELYISQGFFEKAVEIYERMLVDKPNSRGLQDKLSWVRAAVARTATPSSEQKNEADMLAAQEAREYLPASEVDEIEVEPLEEHWPQQTEGTPVFKPEAVTEGLEHVPTVEPDELLIEGEVVANQGEVGPDIKASDEDIVAEPSEYQPAAGSKEHMRSEEFAGFNVLADSPVQAQVGLKRDFEPREYIPPQMERDPKEATSDHEHEKRVSPVPGRKETIARLESWLTTIKKEK